MAEDVQSLAKRLRDNIGQVIVGKESVVDRLITAFLCGGHILLEDIPGTGKTTLAKALAKSVDCDFKRLQFTPDLLPGDITGFTVFDQKTGEFRFRQGAVFTNILLGDEINRATPRTQSALLEAMEERQVSVDGRTYPMERPFLVIATQNPIETAGTFPLPEAQLDRFFMRLSMGYPDRENERKMLGTQALSHPLDELKAVTAKEAVLEAQEQVRKIRVGEAVKDYMLALAEASRSSEKIRLGVSPRGLLTLQRAAQGWAALQGKAYVSPDDVKEIAPDVLSHRILCRTARMQSGSASETARQQVLSLLDQVPVPAE